MIRKEAAKRGEPTADYLEALDLRFLDGVLQFDSVKASLGVKEIQSGGAHDQDEMEESFASIKENHLLIILNGYWFGVRRADGDWLIYNCHCSPEHPAKEATGQEPASVVKIKSAKEAAQAIRHFAAFKTDMKG